MLRPLAWHRKTVKLTRQSDREIRYVDHFLDFTSAFSQDLAHFHRYQRCEIVFEMPEFVRDFAHDLPALGCRNQPPTSEHFDGFRNDLVVISRGG
jgi:hypothetical protein